MKIGLVIYGSLSTLSGGTLYDRILVEHLRRCGDTVEVVSLPWRDYGRHLGDNLSRGWRRRLAALDVDVLVQDELCHPSLFQINGGLRERVGAPIVSIVHHLRCSELRAAWKNRLYRAVERRYLGTIDGFVFNSHTTRRAVESLTEPRPCVVAYPGGDRLGGRLSDAEIGTRVGRGGALRLLFFGNVIERKGLHTLIEALEQVGSEDWTLDIVGGLEVEPGYVVDVRRQIEACGLGGRVRFHGAVLDGALEPFLAGSDALVLPSSYEGFGIVYMEAAAFGLPSIASSAGGASEIVTHGEGGYLVDPGDAAGLAEMIGGWVAHRDVLGRMSLAARARYDAHPTWAQSAEAIRRFLLSMIDAP